MKQLQRLTIAAVLVLTIAMSSLAGEIPIPGAAPTPTPPNSSLTITPGEIPIEDEDSASQVVEELALDLLQTLLSLY